MTSKGRAKEQIMIILPRTSGKPGWRFQLKSQGINRKKHKRDGTARSIRRRPVTQ